MKMTASKKRAAIEEDEQAQGTEQMLEEEAKQAGSEVALGLITPAPYGAAAPNTPVPGTPAPATPAPRTPATAAPAAPNTPGVPVPATPGLPFGQPRKVPTTPPSTAMLAGETGGGSSSSRRALNIPDIGQSRPLEDVAGESPMRRQMREEHIRPGELDRGTAVVRKREAVIDVAEGDENPTMKVQTIQTEFSTGDSMLAEEILQSALNDESDAEEDDEDPPGVSEEQLQQLDAAARKKEEGRHINMGVLEKIETRKEEEGSYNITTKMVMTWKPRLEKGGWFRRAKLVARQFRWSVFSDDSFAPTSAAVIMKLLAQLAVRTSMLLFTVDVKDAFLMIPQPADEKATVTTVNGKCKLLRNLPGQRNAAALWFRGFKDVSTEFGMESDVMQRTLMRKVGSSINDKEGRIFFTIHVDDLMIVADEGEMQKFMEFLRSKNWSVEVKGPFNMSDTVIWSVQIFEAKH